MVVSVAGICVCIYTKHVWLLFNTEHNLYKQQQL